MRLIEPKVEIISQGKGIDGVYEQIEKAGRTCYKSEDKINQNSAVDFVKMLSKNKHTAMFEHGTIYLTLHETSDTPEEEYKDIMYTLSKYEKNPYSKVASEGTGTLVGHENTYYITTNFRVIVENNWWADLEYCTEPTPKHPKRITVRFTCDRGVSHELVRHRVFSFAQESTRFCNYSKDKFGNELTFIIPSWLELNPGSYSFGRDSDGHKFIEGDGYYYDMTDGIDIEPAFIYALMQVETNYFTMLTLGWSPQQARQLLPNALKTEVVMTGFVSDWKHFFELRCAKNAHPDMQLLANQLKEEFKKRSIL